MVAANSVWTMHSDMASAPGMDCYAITPSDTTNFNAMFRGVYVGGAGNVVVVTPSGSVVTFVGAQAGSVIPVMGVRVNFTSTTATSLVGLV